MSFRINDNVAVSDVDGVLLDFDKSFAAVGSSVLPRPMVKESNSYNLAIRYGLDSKESARVWSAMDSHENGWSNLVIIPGAAEAIKRLQRHGMSVRLVTGILPKLAEIRLANLSRHGIEVDAIDCVGFGHASKAEPLRRHAPAMFFDDRLHLLHEADFVPHRVWIDRDDEQDGCVVDESIYQTKDLLTWVKQWETSQGLDRIPFEFSDKVVPIRSPRLTF